MQTYKLNTGVHVLARPLKDGSLYPYTYINRTQAENAARKHGGEVYQSLSTSRVFYVAPLMQDQPHDSDCPVNHGCACYCDK
jgi:hypothetical protein